MMDPSEARLIRDEIIAAATTDLRAPAAGSASILPGVADRLRRQNTRRTLAFVLPIAPYKFNSAGRRSVRPRLFDDNFSGRQNEA
jgi:hypothetical protein